jgi:spore coat polysaccharide biosynthesis predicted glycosyltransferase SpsG
MQISSDKTMTALPQNSQSAGSPDLWIRTAASPKLGFGHLRRSLVLAEELKDCCTPLFLLDYDDSWSKGQLEKASFGYFNGGVDKAWEVLPDPVAILIDTRLAGGLDRLLAVAKTRRIPVISIHDLGLNMLPSDIIVDGSIASADGYATHVDAEYYTGTDYMILSPAYRGLYLQNRPIRKKIRSIFVNLGGGYSGKYFLKVLEGLQLWAREVDVIGVPGFTAWGQELMAQKNWSPLHFRWENRDIEQNLFHSDLAITSGGIAAYEALCAGTPLLALSYDHLQQITIRRLSSLEACIDLGLGDELDPAKLAEVLSPIETDVHKRRRLSCHGRQIVDGKGFERVAQIIRQSIPQNLQQIGRGC